MTAACRCAVLLRGHHSRQSVGTDRWWGPIDWRASAESLHEAYVVPRRRAGCAVDIFFHTHPSDDSDELSRTLRPAASSTAPAADQVASGLTALRLAATSGVIHDEFLWSRFDLLFKLPVDQWKLKREAFNVPFKDLKGAANDVFYVFAREQLGAFTALVEAAHGKNHSSLQDVRSFPFAVHLMSPHRYQAETDWPQFWPERDNPFYVLWRRRRFGPQSEAAACAEAARVGVLSGNASCDAFSSVMGPSAPAPSLHVRSAHAPRLTSSVREAPGASFAAHQHTATTSEPPQGHETA